jgi:Putative beta-barrel porin-2, OmpL-like. bbp2
MLSPFLIGLTLAVGQVEPVTAPPRALLGTPVAAMAADSQGEPTVASGGVVRAQMETPAAPAATPKEVVPVAPTAEPAAAPDQNGGNGDKKEEKKEDDKKKKDFSDRCFLGRFWGVHYNVFTGRTGDEEEPTPERRMLPEPWSSPPFPGHEYQGYPLIGASRDTNVNPLMEAVYGGPGGDWIKSTKILLEGWCTVGGNYSTAKESNAPMSYWVVPNRLELDQLVFRLHRELDSVQTDHIDWGFRSTLMYGMDYRYMTAGGWFSDQLLEHNLLYGWDPTEQYFDVYFPWNGGNIVRIGRWIACPDIETQWAPDNYMASHSLQFTVDTYTQTGIMDTQWINKQNLVQIGLNAGNDMAPWYKGATPSGFLAWRWVSASDWTAFYTVLNQINNAEFRHFQQYGQPLGHDNFNYIVSTWEQKLTQDGSIHTKTEAYYMWERNAELGGTPSAGPVKPFGLGGGDAPTIPGLSENYGVLNYTMFALGKQSYFTIRNECMHDTTGFRYGAPGWYTSHSIGVSYNINSMLQVRPEIGYYRNWDNPVFDNLKDKGIVVVGFDCTYRF